MAALVLFSALSLLVTVGLLLSGSWQRSVPPASITLLRDSVSTVFTTNARTVGEFMQQQQITLSADQSLLEAPDTPITNGMILAIVTARSVTLTIDGKDQILRTFFTSPLDILTSIAYQPQPGDRFWLDGTETSIQDFALWPVPVTQITIQHARSITIIDGDQQTTILTHAATVADALYQAGIPLFLTDSVQPESGAPLPEDGRILIDRARTVFIQVDGVTIETRVRGATVAHALIESGVPLLGLDYTIPPSDTPIEAGMLISVLRVTETIESYQENIPYETVYQADAELELDARVIVQGGQVGIRRYDERVRFENGVEVGREALGSVVVQEAVAETVAYGTRIVIRTVDTPEGPREYWRRLRMYATSYHPAALGGDDRTAIGETLRRGIVASVPAIIPYRTAVFVPDYGLGMMADTGGARSTPYWIDLGYSDEDFVSWSRYVDVYLLTPVPANVTYLLPDWRPVRGRPDN
jgi:uncharacterized protein YabE (DUF348 family)